MKKPSLHVQAGSAEGVVTLAALSDRVLGLYHDGQPSGVHPGWEHLADYYTVLPGQVTVVTGIPNHGKSEWLDALLVNLAEAHNWKFAIYSPENHPVEMHAAKLIEKRTRKPFSYEPSQQLTEEECAQAVQWVGQHFYFWAPQEHSYSLETILSIGKHLALQEGLQGLLIDPWNEIEHQRPVHMSETEYISRCLSDIRYFARTHQVHVWVVAHPTKLLKEINIETQKYYYPVPTPYDISGSANWFNKADCAITIWRNVFKSDEPVQVHVQKMRSKHVGRLGRVLMSYDSLTGRYNQAD